MPTFPPVAFMAPFAVYKATMDEGRKRWDDWVGFVADSQQGKVVWDDGTTTVYGPKTKENPKFYSDVCLAEDKLLTASVRSSLNTVTSQSQV